MKQAFGATLLLLAAALCSGVLPALADDADLSNLRAYTVVKPLRNVTTDQVMSAVQNQATLPMWSYKINSPVDGKNYLGVMVGGSPFFNGARTTSVPVLIVPIIIVMPDGTTFDPTVLDSCSLSTTLTPVQQVLQSPVFSPTSFSMNGINLGNGIYSDEFQRANFHSANVAATGNSYHTVLNPITVLPAVTVTIPTIAGVPEGKVYNQGCNNKIGVMDLNTFDQIITTQVIPSLASQNVNPTTLPVFLLHDVVMGDPGTNLNFDCCVFGYHGAFGSPVQTYAVPDYDTTGVFRVQFPDIADLSHEIAEWMDDPIGTNPTPGWGNIGQVQGCQNDLEVGDPLTATNLSGVLMPNGITYHPQELAFFSWFLRQNPSLGAGGKYSSNGTFTTTAGAVCH